MITRLGTYRFAAEVAESLYILLIQPPSQAQKIGARGGRTARSQTWHEDIEQALTENKYGDGS